MAYTRSSFIGVFPRGDLMFDSLGGSELLLVLVLALLLFGPRRLPQIGRTIGRGMAEFRKATNELKTNLEREVRADEIREVRSDFESLNREVRSSVEPISPRKIVERVLGGDEAAPSKTRETLAGAPPTTEADPAPPPSNPESDVEDDK
jgi:sec-independent protein translocase protein TatA